MKALWRAFSMRSLFGVVVACLLVGCATPPASELTPHEWASIQTLAIAPGPEPTEITLWALDARTGAKVGVIKAVEVANILTLGLWPLAFYGAGAVCVPALGAGVGAMVGAIRAPEDEELAEIQNLLLDLIPPACLPEVIKNDLLDAGTGHANARRLVSLDAIEGRAARARAPSLRDRGIDAVLEVTIDTIEVSGPWGTNPDGALRMLVRFELIDTRDESILLEGSHLEKVDRKLIEDWWQEPNEESPDPAAALRERLDKAAKASALAIAEAVFLKFPWIPPRADRVTEFPEAE